jgi:hypothetical protein
MEIDRKLKTALDESRLLILGAQVLFGFQFQSVFQDEFSTLPAESQDLQGLGLLLLLTSIGLLVAPSLFHQIACGGESRYRAIRAATTLTGASLLPLSVGLGVSTYVVFEHMFDRSAGLAVGSTLTLVALGLLYGWGLLLRPFQEAAPVPDEAETPLRIRIEQLLTEARVMIPGAQALLGFQFIATLTKSFGDLPPTARYVHAGGLCAVALAATLLMTTAALHRLAFKGEDRESFFKIGSRLVVGAAIPLAIGIAADIYVVFMKIAHSEGPAATAAAVAFLLLLSLWFVLPLWMRNRVA